MKPIFAYAAFDKEGKISQGCKVFDGAIWLDTPTELRLYTKRSEAKRHAPFRSKIKKVRIRVV